MVSSGYGCHPDEKDFTCKFKHPHGYIERLCHLSIWRLLVVSSGYGCPPDEKDFTCKLMHPTWPHREQLCHLSIWRLLVVSSGYGCHPDEKDFTCKFMHPHGHTENNYVTCQYGDYWWLALVMDVIQMRRTSLVSLCIHMATQRTTMSPVNMETTGG